LEIFNLLAGLIIITELVKSAMTSARQRQPLFQLTSGARPTHTASEHVYVNLALSLARAKSCLRQQKKLSPNGTHNVRLIKVAIQSIQ
jgi:hypothetical protein